MNRPVRVGITHGDINGIGYEIIMKALADETFTDLCTPVVFGSPKLFSFYRKQLGINDFYYRQIASAENVADGEINVVNISNEDFKVTPGQPSPEGGAAALLSLEKGVEAVMAGHVDVLVTAPIDKHTIQSDRFRFAGHTEYLREKAGEGSRSLMILFADALRVALVTTHLPISEVSAAISKERIVETVKLFDASLRADFACERPKIAVLSLNPHCGDNGLLGHEEKDVIAPAIEECLNEGILAFGPYSADGFFAGEGIHAFDGVVAMYHDQGLAPFKALARDRGVNFTAGLPFVRTSPDHGTAYDIAGKGVADPVSMREAIYQAIDIFRRRRVFESASANPLARQTDTRKGDKEKPRRSEEKPEPNVAERREKDQQRPPRRKDMPKQAPEQPAAEEPVADTAPAGETEN